jgi:hypothetical protein
MRVPLMYQQRMRREGMRCGETGDMLDQAWIELTTSGKLSFLMRSL